MSESRRFEVKIPIPLNRLQKVQVWLNTHLLAFKTHHPERWVNSLYLDLPNLLCYEENLSGISHRRKVRIRWYNALDNALDSTLEFKHRQAGKGYKVTFGTSLDLASTSGGWPNILRESYRNLPDEGRLRWDNDQYPVLICRYLRNYYQSGCGRIRATFDTNMSVFDQRYRAQVNLRRSESLGEYVLLELKCDEQYEAELSSLISTCPLRPSRHSKYVNGVRQLTWV